MQSLTQLCFNELLINMVTTQQLRFYLKWEIICVTQHTIFLEAKDFNPKTTWKYPGTLTVPVASFFNQYFLYVCYNFLFIMKDEVCAKDSLPKFQSHTFIKKNKHI